jgi:AAA+ ATPase superfamily predicted ATPase
MTRIFLSYARQDEQRVERLYEDLSNAGLTPWMDTKDILPGERWKPNIQKAIRASDFFLACLSTNAVGKRGFLQKEIKEALDVSDEMLDRDIYLIPVRLDDCEVPERLSDWQWVDLFEGDGWDRLMGAIQVGKERRMEELTPEEELVRVQPINPFLYKARVPPERFIGRKQELDIILDRLADLGNPGASAIYGPNGIGKTSLLQILETPDASRLRPELAPETVKFVYIPSYLVVPFSVAEFWRYLFSELEQWPANQFRQQATDVLAMLEKGPPYRRHPIISFFRSIGKTQLVIVLFDNLDRVINQIQSKEYHDKPDEEKTQYLNFLGTIAALLNATSPRGFSLIVASEQPIHGLLQKQFIDFGSALYSNMISLCLGPFSKAECEELLNSYLKDTEITFRTQERNELHKDSGGYPAKFQEAAFELFDNKWKQRQKAKIRVEGRMPKMGRLPLSYNDRRRLQKELNKLPTWADGDKTGERALLRAAGLPDDYVRSLTLSGVPTIDSPNVIANLESLGHLENRPTHYALGALIEYLLDNTPSAEGKMFLACLLARYRLITTSDYVKELHEVHGLLEIPASDEIVDLGWQTENPPFSWQGPTDPDELERIWNTAVPFLDAVFLEKGGQVTRAVCRVERAADQPLGTGFLIGPDLVLTNHHVVPSDEVAEETQVRFGYRLDQTGQLTQGETHQVKRALSRSPENALDYVVLQLDTAPGENPEIGHLYPAAQELKRDSRLYIIQHPSGDPQKVVLQGNRITYVADNHHRVQYLTNTKRGSSGSPVCNENWEVVALHHSGGPLPSSPETSHIRGNEGIPMLAILPEIEDLLPN